MLPPSKLSLTTYYALIVITSGLAVLMGWALHSAALIQLFPNLVPMVPDTALCFILLGINLLTFDQRIKNFWLIRLATILLVLTVSITTLTQDITHLYIGIDNLYTKDWLDDATNITTGRMAPNTAVGFILACFLTLGLPFGDKKYFSLIIQALNISVLLIAITGFIVYSLSLEYIFSSYDYTRMALTTAVLFSFLSLGYWEHYKHANWYSEFYKRHEDRRIIFIIGSVFIAISLITGLGSIAALSYRNIIYIQQNYQQILQEKVNIFVTSINNVIKDLEVASHDLRIVRAEQTNNIDSHSTKEVLNLLAAKGFSALTLTDKEGKILSTDGKFIAQLELSIPLNFQFKPILFWHNGFGLKVTIPVYDQTGVTILGYLIGERALDTINQMFSNYSDMGSTGETVICAKFNVQTAECFPSRLSPTMFKVPLIIENKLSAMGHALQHETGSMNAIDYRFKHVVAAYSPLGNTGLGIVSKIDTYEIYKPIHDDLIIAAPFVLFLIFCGLAALNWQIAPLVQKIIDSEKEAISNKKELQISEERYSIAAENSDIGLWDWEAAINKIYYSPKFKRLLGYADDEFPNTVSAHTSVIHPEDRERVLQSLRFHVEKNIPYNIEYRIRKKTGEYHWYQGIGQATRTANGEPIRMSGSLADITERKKTEARLTMQYNLSRILTESNSLEECANRIIQCICEGTLWPFGALWVVDKKNSHLDCLAAWKSASLSNQSFMDATLKIKYPIGKGLPGRVWSTGTPAWIPNLSLDDNYLRIEQAQEAKFSSAFGFPILLNSDIVGVIELFSCEKEALDERLITITSVMSNQIAQFIQRNKIETRLRKSEAHNAAILESATDSIITINGQGNIVAFNPQTKKLFNYTSQELKNINIKVLISDLSVSKIDQVVNKPPAEFMAKAKSDVVFPVEITISTMGISTKSMYVCIIRDVTERKKVDKLKSEFVSVVSHELRTPLTSIRGSLGLILGGAVGSFSEKATHLLTIANNNCERLLNLINDILDIEKIEAGKMQFNYKSVDLGSIVSEAITNNQMYAEKFHVRLKSRNMLQGIIVRVDPDRLMQVLTNLISNAVKFSHTSGEVYLNMQKINKQVRVSVIDQGAGIPKEFQRKIFQRFSQADSSSTRSVGGTGLGLSITKAIVERMGGSINFTSKINQGSEFYIDLPEMSEMGTEQQSPLNKLSSNEIQALLVCEDDEDQAAFIQLILQEAGYQVDMAYTAHQAKEFLKNKSYQALILDLILPDEDGISLIKELRAQANTENLPIIVLSVIANDTKLTFDNNACLILDWLEKPVDQKKLFAALNIIHQPHSEKKRILHVEDDSNTQLYLKQLLADAYDMVSVSTLESAYKEIVNSHFDLVILDLALPDGNAQEVLPLLANHHLPVIVFSSTQLDESYMNQVKKVLSKQQTSAKDLLSTVNTLLSKLTKTNKDSSHD